jgi:hypothetical protein
MFIANEKPRWFFYLGWVALNVIAVIMAWYIAWAIMSQVTNIVGGRIQVGGESHITEDFLLVYVLFPIIGLLTGIFQYLLLRRYLPHMVWWITATLVGWLMPFIIGFIISALLAPSNNTFLIMLGMLLIGTAIALPQWWMLRQRVHHASWWLLAYAIGWWMVGLLNFITTEPIPILLAVGLIPAITTCIACWLLLGWSQNHELKGSVSSH